MHQHTLSSCAEYSCTRHEKEAKKNEDVSPQIFLTPSYATACNSLQKKPVDVTGYFLPSNETYYSLAPSGVV